ncbi:helicase-related protein [Burkholderia ubonensis]|uniref:helicase-related protein n=1 Tax=Burkholderia ubonensis TaxID=101571 RepID=UPI000AF76359|nr:helicase-related protein [Burkholderia ubonensis]
MDALASPPKTTLRVTRSLIGNKMWLVAGMDTGHFSGDFKVRGYIDESFLATQAQWKKLSSEARDELEAERIEACSEALEAALIAAVVEVSEYVTTCAAEGLNPNLRKLRDVWSSGELNLATVEATLDQSLTDLRATKHHHDLAAQIAKNVKLSDYPETFPAFHRKRKLIAVLGPTNSGKTYDAFKRLASARAGAYLGPLRLLALEAFTRLNEEFGVVASLITGEERRIVPGSRVTASTIEMLDVNRDLEVAVIDEIQMLTDPDRGWAWTQAVVGANADEVWLLGALSAEPAIRALAERLGLPLEIRKKERKHPLVVAEQSLAPHPNNALRMAKPGDAFIVFSRRDALNLRDDLLAMKQSVACIYGALSPEVRESEARRFASGEADILVATDAIGMGLNLPIQRIVFTSVTKYDGTERGELPVPLLQQIGGRAGRYGHTGEEGVVVGLTPAEHKVVNRLMSLKQENLPTSGFMVTPGAAYLEQLATMSGDNRLEALLSLFMMHCDRGDRFFVPHVPEEQLTKAAQLDRLVHLPLALKHTFSMAPMTSNHEDIDQAWRTWARLANQGKAIRLNFLPGNPETASLEDAETTVRLLAAYRWFGYRLPELFVDYEEAESVLEPWIAAVDEHLKSRRKQGVGGGRKGMPSWYWAPKATDLRLVDVDLQPVSMTMRRRR